MDSFKLSSNSKIDKDDYLPEFENNATYLGLMIDEFWSYYSEVLNDDLRAKVSSSHLSFMGKERNGFSNFMIPYRFADLCEAITDDLYRYCEYHKLEKISKPNLKSQLYDIDEPVRAAFYMKWIAKIRPVALDILLSGHHNNVEKYDLPFLEDEGKLNTDLLMCCNEYFAMISASVIFCIPQDENEGDILSFEDIFDNEDRVSIKYGLRYRLVHQDAYIPFLTKIFSSKIRLNSD